MVRRVISMLLFLAVALAPWSGAAAAFDLNAKMAPNWKGPSPNATILVTAFQDDAADNGNCTLREAVLAANSDQAVDRCPAGQGADTIQLAAGNYVLSLEGRDEETGKTGDLDLTSDLRIVGAGQQATTISGASSDRLLHIRSKAAHVQLSNLTLQKGGIRAGEGSLNGLGILNEGALVLEQVSIQGNGQARAQGNGAGIYNSGTLTLRDSSVSQNTLEDGQGTGIYNAGVLTVMNSQIRQNQAVGGAGGGIYNTGTAALTGCQVDDNGFSGGSGSAGGALYNEGRMVLENCTVLNGSAEAGALVVNQSEMTLLGTVLSGGHNRTNGSESILTEGSLNLIQSQVKDNLLRGIAGRGELSVHSSSITGNRAVPAAGSEETGGGGIAFDGKLLMVNSVVDQNQASGGGGGLLGAGEWTILNSSIVSNTVANRGEGASGYGYGGGIYWHSGAITLTNSTVVGNNAAAGGGGIFLGAGTARLSSATIAGNRVETGEGGGLAVMSSEVSLFNTLLAGNQGQAADGGSPDCFQFTTDPEDEEPARGSVTSRGYNLIGVSEGCELTRTAGDRFGTGQSPLHPRLGSLSMSGGTTFVQELLPESPAVDAGPAASDWGDEGCLPYDQRGIARPQGAACDVGAFELSQTPDAITVQIDILPGSPQNGISPTNQGTIPVAILSSTNFFSPSQVNSATLTFGRIGDEAALDWLTDGSQPNCSTRDINRDGILDLICRFRLPQTGLREGDTQGTLRGETWNGLKLEGSDAVQVSTAAVSEGSGQSTQTGASEGRLTIR